MSTLVAQTISNGTVSTSSANVIQGSAKAWVNYNASSQTIRASYNVSSVTYTNTGRFTINMTNAMTDVNYAVVVTAAIDQASQASFQETTNFTRTTSAFAISILVAGGYNNPTNTSVAVFR